MNSQFIKKCSWINNSGQAILILRSIYENHWNCWPNQVGCPNELTALIIAWRLRISRRTRTVCFYCFSNGIILRKTLHDAWENKNKVIKCDNESLNESWELSRKRFKSEPGGFPSALKSPWWISWSLTTGFKREFPSANFQGKI